MAIAFDSVGTSGNIATSGTTKHTIVSNTNAVLVAFFFINSGVGTITASPTFRGTAMTKVIGQANSFGGVTSEAWYLLNPPTGLGTVLGTISAGNRIDIISQAYTGVDQTTPIAGSIGGTSPANGTSGTINTTISGNNWFVGATGIHTGPGTIVTGNQRGTLSIASYNSGADSTGGTLQWKFSTDNSAMVGVQLTAAGAAVASSLNTLGLMGVGLG